MNYAHFSTTMVEHLLHKFATQSIESTRMVHASAERWICQNLPNDMGQKTTYERKYAIMHTIRQEWDNGNLISTDNKLYSKDEL